METSVEKKKLETHWPLVISTSIVLVIISVVSIGWTKETAEVLNAAYVWFGTTFGPVFTIINAAAFFIAVYFAFSKWGNFKFGEKDEKPEFSLFAWCAMIFCTVIGGPTLFWAIIQPLLHLNEVPFERITPLSKEAYVWAHTFTMFKEFFVWHWMMLAALPVAYSFYIKKKNFLRYCEVIESVVGEKHARGTLGVIAEAIFIISSIFAIAAVLGISTPLVSAALAKIFGTEASVTYDIMVVIVCSAMFIITTMLGLEKGISTLAKYNVYIAFGFIFYAFFTGPSMFILQNFSNSVGVGLDNFFQILLGTEPWAEKGWKFQIDWSQFLILWFVSQGPLVGLFTARISRGRTVREILLGGCGIGIVGTWITAAIFNSYTLKLQFSGEIDLLNIIKTQGTSAALVTVLETLPGSWICLVIFTIFTTMYTATCMNSTAYILATSTTREILPGQEPSMPNRAYWAAILGLVAMGILFIGGLDATRAFSSVSGLLMLPIVACSFISWFKAVKEESLKFDK